jgi:hypothetical protein
VLVDVTVLLAIKLPVLTFAVAFTVSEEDILPPVNKAPDIPAPPDTTRAPVVVLVDVTVLLAIKLPVLTFAVAFTVSEEDILPPVNKAPDIPAPPDTTRAPVVVLVDVAVLLAIKLPVLTFAVAFKVSDEDILPPVNKAPDIPAPPETTRAPVVVLVDALVLDTVIGRIDVTFELPIVIR